MASIGYIRQSRRADLDVALSPEQQAADIARLAAHDGTDPETVTIYRDLGRSGGQDKERLRSGYQGMLTQLASGGVEVIYSKALTRLARSVTELYRVLRLAQEHGTRIHTAKEGVMDPASPIGKAQFGMLAVFAEFERDLAVERARDNVAMRRTRGERMGRVPYGERPGDQPEAILDAYRESGGSLNGTALLLNEREIKSWAGVLWTGPALRLVIKRLVPGTIPNRASRGVKPSSPFLLYRLLRCACGQTMTGSRPAGRRTVYRCHTAGTTPDHQRPWLLRESVILPWIKAEAARLRPPTEPVALADSTEAQQAILREDVDRLRVAFLARLIDEPEMLVERRRIDEALARLDFEGRIVTVPGVTWTAEPRVVNRELRALWASIQLDAEMRPVAADWLLPPEWIGPPLVAD